MNSTAHSHRVFEALQGLWPVTFANVREADPQGLLDLFHGNHRDRDQYLAAVIAHTRTSEPRWVQRNTAGRLWAESQEGLGIDHTDACYHTDDSGVCCCEDEYWDNNSRWGTELFEAIQQRIDQLNG